MVSAPCLHIPDFSEDKHPPVFEVHTDASDFALGATLFCLVNGKLKPVAYHSRKFTPAEVNYSTTDKELLAIVDALRTWRHYLYGLTFVVRTDHKPL